MMVFIDRIDDIDGNKVLNKIDLDFRDCESKLFYSCSDSIILSLIHSLCCIHQYLKNSSSKIKKLSIKLSF